MIEDRTHASDACKALHELGYDGVPLIADLVEAEQHLDDIVANLTAAPDAIVSGRGATDASGVAL